MSESVPSLETLRLAIRLACQSQNTGRIIEGRNLALNMPRIWVLNHLEQVAADALDLTDPWDYRRLLELAVLLDARLVLRLGLLGQASNDPELREVSEDFNSRRVTTLS